MNLRQIAEAVLVAIAVLTVLLSSVGLLRGKNAYAKLHFLGPATFLAPICLALATLLERGFSQQGNKALFVALLLLAYSPVVTHATGRALLRRAQSGEGVGHG